MTTLLRCDSFPYNDVIYTTPRMFYIYTLKLSSADRSNIITLDTNLNIVVQNGDTDFDPRIE